MADDAISELDRDRQRAWLLPMKAHFAWACTFLAMLSLIACGAYWSTRRNGSDWPMASRRLRHLVAQARGFPHPGMHLFALFSIFWVLAIVQTVAWVPLTAIFYLAFITRPPEVAEILLALLMLSSLLATGATALRTFTGWAAFLFKLAFVNTRRGGFPAAWLWWGARLTRRLARRGGAFLVISGIAALVSLGVVTKLMEEGGMGRFNPTAGTVEWVLLTIRMAALDGASFLATVALLGLTALVWTFAQLRQVRLHQNAWLLRSWGVLPPYGCARELFFRLGLATPIDQLLKRVEGVWPSPRTVLCMLGFDVVAVVLAHRLVIFERLPLGTERLLPPVFVLLLGLLAWGCARALGAWRELRRLLAVVSTLPMGMACGQLPRSLLEVFRSPLSNETEQIWRSYSLHLLQQMSVPPPSEKTSTSALLAVVSASEEEVLTSSWGAQVHHRSPQSNPMLDSWAELVGLRLLAFVGYVRAHIFNGLGTVTAATLPLLWLTTMYPFQSSRLLLALALALVSMSIVVTLVILTQMNRDEILSRVEGTDPGKITWDFSFLSGLLVHGALPLAALVSVKFPALGRTVTDTLFTLVRSLGKN